MRSLAGLALLAGLASGCSPAVDAPIDEGEGPASSATPISVPIAPEVLGYWVLARQECEPDVEDAMTDQRLGVVTLWLDESGQYEMMIDGWRSVGSFRVSDDLDGKRVTLDDTLQNFDLVDGTLQNWSEGDATSLCGNVFERAGEG